MKVTFITPCSRPENLKQLYDSIFDSAPKGMDVNWIIVVDSRNIDTLVKENADFKNTRIHYLRAGISGNPQRNFALDRIKSGHVAFLDDDNIMHHAYLDRAEEYLTTKPNYALVVNQANKDGSLRLRTTSENIGPGFVDTAQIILPIKMIGNIRWKEDDYMADGIFVKEVYDKHSDKFIFLDEAVCYYNYLR